MYKINGFSKMVEVDDYKEGCLPETMQNFEINYVISGKTKEEVIKQVMNFLNVERDAIELNACEENGRIDIQTLEDADGCKASNGEIERWKRGELTLYAGYYVGYLTIEKPAKF